MKNVKVSDLTYAIVLPTNLSSRVKSALINSLEYILQGSELPYRQYHNEDIIAFTIFSDSKQAEAQVQLLEAAFRVTVHKKEDIPKEIEEVM